MQADAGQAIQDNSDPCPPQQQVREAQPQLAHSHSNGPDGQDVVSEGQPPYKKICLSQFPTQDQPEKAKYDPYNGVNGVPRQNSCPPGTLNSTLFGKKVHQTARAAITEFYRLEDLRNNRN